MIAKAFSDYVRDENVLIFASGVSDSKQENPAAFLREESLIRESLRLKPQALFVYFSTYSVLDPLQASTAYAQHKIRMEEIIVQSGVPFLILRASNVVGNSGNPLTVFNFIRDHILSGKSFDVWMNACRNFIDLDDLVKITRYLIETIKPSGIYTVANPFPVSVPDFVCKMEIHLGKKANMNQIQKGNWFQPDTSFVMQISNQANVEFDSEYIDRLIQKYSK